MFSTLDIHQLSDRMHVYKTTRCMLNELSWTRPAATKIIIGLSPTYKLSLVLIVVMSMYNANCFNILTTHRLCCRHFLYKLLETSEDAIDEVFKVWKITEEFR